MSVHGYLCPKAEMTRGKRDDARPPVCMDG